MIKIKRADCPKSLSIKSKAKAAFRNRKVVETLWNMQHKKCAYCEVEIPVEGHQKAVDHFRPKAIFKGRVMDWKNLVLACAQCNGKKSDKFPVQLTKDDGEAKVVYIKSDTHDSGLLIDPTDPTIDPEEHLDFLTGIADGDYGLISAKNNSSRGQETITVIGLDNSYYTSLHRKHIRAMFHEFLVMLTARDQGEPAIEEQCKASFQMKLSAKAPFSAVARAFAKENRLDINFGLNMPTGWDSA